MSMISILTPPIIPASAQENGNTDPSNTKNKGNGQSVGQRKDTAPPAPVSDSNTSADTTSTGSGTDPVTRSTTSGSAPASDQETTPIAQDTAGDAKSARIAVEAGFTNTPDLTEADARRFAEAAQARQRLELLIEAVQTPVQVTPLVAPAAAQAEAGPTETDGTPV